MKVIFDHCADEPCRDGITRTADFSGMTRSANGIRGEWTVPRTLTR